MQLRFASFVVINLRWDLHPQECAHAGRTKKSPYFKGLLHFIRLCWIVKWWRRWDSNPRPKTVSQKLIHAYPLIFSFRLIRRLRESFGIGQPGLSYLPAPDGVGKTSLVCDVSAIVQAPIAKRAD
jgi:hypothetical protein